VFVQHVRVAIPLQLELRVAHVTEEGVLGRDGLVELAIVTTRIPEGGEQLGAGQAVKLSIIHSYQTQSGSSLVGNRPLIVCKKQEENNFSKDYHISTRNKIEFYYNLYLFFEIRYISHKKLYSVNMD